MRKYPITKILIKKNLISSTSEAVIQKEGDVSSLSEIELLETLNIITNQRLIHILSDIFHMDVVELEGLILDEKTIEELPHDVIHRLAILPIESTDTHLTVAISDPTNISGLETLYYYTNKKLIFRIALRATIIRISAMHISQSKSIEAVESLKQEMESDVDVIFDNNLEDESDAPTIKLTNAILSEAIMEMASDIHIEPYENELVIRNRIDGHLNEKMRLPISIYPAIIARLKLISGMDISERRVPQEGRLEVHLMDKPVDLRFSTIPNVFGEKLVIRILEKSYLNKGLHELGLQEADYERVERVLKRPNGIILVTGPTGSGKSTTLYGFLNYMKRPEKSIVTVEDPVEFTIEGFNQTQVNLKQGMTFPVALRAILRQDPDIIMIGEIRDEDTANIAVRASITGHLVLSTLHTNSALSSIIRLTDMGIEPYLISDSVRCVIAQRLLRRLCPHCKTMHMSSEVEMKVLNIKKPANIYQSVGCEKCNQTGYHGRFPIFEVLVITAELRKLIQHEADVAELEESIVKQHMSNLYEQGVLSVLRGDTTIQELRGLDDGE